jgi:hypothetical protein
MFVTGCAGDAAPFPRGTPGAAKTHGASLAEEVGRVLSSGKLQPLSGPLRTELRRVDLPLRNFTRAEAAALGGEAWQKYAGERMLKILDGGGDLPKHYTAPFALWRFGRGLTLVGFSGETVVDYVALAEKHFGPLNLWAAGYTNDVFGYLPSARVLREGGYETRGLYLGAGVFDPRVEDVVGNALADMARAGGR